MRATGCSGGLDPVPDRASHLFMCISLGEGSALASVWFEQWGELLGKNSHGLMALDKTGNLALFDIALNGNSACQLVIHWKSIRVRNPLQNAKLHRLIQASVNSDGDRSRPLPPPVKLECPAGKVFYVDVIPLPEVYRDRLDGAHSLLSIREVDQEPASTGLLLQEEFHLTPAEAAVAVQLSQGLSLKQTAGKLNISIWTARSHLRAIFQKTGTHRQAELVSLLAHLDQ